MSAETLSSNKFTFRGSRIQNMDMSLGGHHATHYASSAGTKRRGKIMKKVKMFEKADGLPLHPYLGDP